MKKYLLASFLLFSTGFVFSDGHSSAEKEVIAKVKAYWVARNSADWSSVVAMSSSTGVLNTNSDGSFHKPKTVQTVEDWKDQNVSGTGVVNIHAPEAYELNDDTVFVRYYAEGVVPDANGGMKPYRTRVTSVWTNEKNSWVIKTMHFSSAAYGGTHQTVASDFED